MLILSRRDGECICLGEEIVLTIVSIGNEKVRIGVKAPPGVRILRNELEVREQTLTLPISSLGSPDTISTAAHAQQPDAQPARVLPNAETKEQTAASDADSTQPAEQPAGPPQLIPLAQRPHTSRQAHSGLAAFTRNRAA